MGVSGDLGEAYQHRILASKNDSVIIEIRFDGFDYVDRQAVKEIVADGVVTDEEVIELLRLKSLDVPRREEQVVKEDWEMNLDIKIPFLAIVGLALLLVFLGMLAGMG